MAARMLMNVPRIPVVLVHAASTIAALTSASAQEEQGVIHMCRDVKAPRRPKNVLRTLIVRACSLVKRQPASTPAPPCLVVRMLSASRRTTQPGVAARLVTRKTLRASAPPCATESSAASTPNASSRTVAPPVPAPKEPLAIPSPGAAAYLRPAPRLYLALNLSPVSPASAVNAAIPSHAASMLHVTAKRASVSARKGLSETATSCACLPSCRLSAPLAAESTATVPTASQTSATVMTAWPATLMKAAPRAKWTLLLPNVSVEAMQSAFQVGLEYVCASANRASPGILSSAVKTSMSAQATFVARTLSASTPLEAMTVGVKPNTREIHLRNASRNSLLWQTSAPTNHAAPMQFVQWANVSASQDSRGTLRTQERAASHPPAPTTLTVATMRSASL